MTLPVGALTPAQTRAFLGAVECVRAGRLTVDTLKARLGYRSRSTVWKHLVALRNVGLIAWEDGRHGSMRIAVAPVYRPVSTSTR